MSSNMIVNMILLLRFHGHGPNYKKLLPMMLLLLSECQEVKSVHVSVSEHTVKHPGKAHVHPPGFHGNDSPHHVVHSSDVHINPFEDTGHIHMGDAHMGHSIGHGNDNPRDFVLSAATRNQGNDMPHDFTLSPGTHRSHSHGPDESLQTLGNLDSIYIDVMANHGDGGHHQDIHSHTPDHSHTRDGSSPTATTFADTNIGQTRFHGINVPHHVVHQSGDLDHHSAHSHTLNAVIDHTSSSHDNTFSNMQDSSHVSHGPTNVLTQETALRSGMMHVHGDTGIDPVSLTKAYSGNPSLTNTASETMHNKMPSVDKHSQTGHLDHAHADSLGNHGLERAHQALHNNGIEHRHVNNEVTTNHGSSKFGANQAISRNNQRHDLATNPPMMHVNHGHMLTNDRNIITNIEPESITGSTGGQSQGHVKQSSRNYPWTQSGIAGKMDNHGSHVPHSNRGTVRINLLRPSSAFGRALARLQLSEANSVSPSDVISGIHRPLVMRQLPPTHHSANTIHPQRHIPQQIFLRRRRPNAFPLNAPSLRERQLQAQSHQRVKRLRTESAGTILQELFGNTR